MREVFDWEVILNSIMISILFWQLYELKKMQPRVFQMVKDLADGTVKRFDETDEAILLMCKKLGWTEE